MRVVGITGGIGTGKSTVAALFEARGAARLDADVVARDVVAPGKPAYYEVLAIFGEQYARPDGSLDRAALAELVFRDPDARRTLEAIIHPRVTQAIQEHLIALQQQNEPPAVVVVEIPLLYEAGLDWLVDETVVVSSEQRTQVERLKTRTGMSSEQARLRIAAQMPLAEKERRADHVIRTECSLAEVRRQVDRVWHDLMARTPTETKR